MVVAELVVTAVGFEELAGRLREEELMADPWECSLSDRVVGDLVL